MTLTPQQRDAINELANIAVGKSASTLSMMIGREIKIDVPVVELVPRDNLAAFFNQRYVEDILGVSIGFDGDFSGTSTLFFERKQGKTLVDKLLSAQEEDEDDWDIKSNHAPASEEDTDLLFSDTDKEALIEMGNIMINGLMGSVSNLLHTVLNYSLPELQLNFSFSDLSPENQSPDQNNALLLETHFKDADAEIEGFLTLVFEFGEHINRFLEAVDSIIEASGDDEF
jgi:chemotaxis protein CheC